jgi:hypothetical protein
MSYRRTIYAAALVTLGLGLFLLRLWQPELQVRKHSGHLTDAIAHQDWARFASFIADDYHDQWGNDRNAVLDNSREVFRRLRDVRFSAIGPNIRIENGAGYWRAFIIIDGPEDSELMKLIKARVNTLPTPFELEWRRMSSKPWDWKLVAVRNPELNISAEY